MPLHHFNPHKKIAGVFHVPSSQLKSQVHGDFDFRADTVFSKRIRHTAKFCVQRAVDFQFNQFIWGDTTSKRSVRVVKLVPIDSENVNFEISPVHEKTYKQLFPELNTTIWDNLQDVILISEAEPIEGPGPRVIYVNQSFEKMTGYAANEIIGKTPRMLQGKLSSEFERLKIRKALHAWQPVNAEIINYKKDGTTFNVELNISPVADESGWWTYWVAIQRDQTGKKIDQEIQSTSVRAQAVQTLASGIAHDLNNRLALIAGHAQLASLHLEKNKIPEAIARIAELKTGIINCRDITSQFMHLNQRGSHLDKVTHLDQKILEYVTSITSGTKVTPFVDPAVQKLAPIQTDWCLVSQGLQNLVINSLEAMKETAKLRKPEIFVSINLQSSSSSRDALMLVRVQDNGGGIPDSVQRKIFSPYVSSKPQGNGLGLFTTQANLHFLGGFLRLIETSPEGTTFELGIPLIAHENHEHSSQDKTKALQKDLPVLIVDDEVDLAE